MLKAFYDPQDDHDRAMLTERLDEIERDIRNGDADEDELAELRDMNDNLTDDTRYRVQDLMRRIDQMTQGKSGDRQTKSWATELTLEEMLEPLDPSVATSLRGRGFTGQVDDTRAAQDELRRAIQRVTEAFDIVNGLLEQFERDGQMHDRRPLAAKSPAGAHAFYR